MSEVSLCMQMLCTQLLAFKIKSKIEESGDAWTKHCDFTCLCVDEDLRIWNFASKILLIFYELIGFFFSFFFSGINLFFLLLFWPRPRPPPPPPEMSRENEKQPAQAPEQVPPGCKQYTRESLRQIACARSDGGRVEFFAVCRELSRGLDSGQARGL